MEFSRQEYWSGLPCSSPGDLPTPGIEPRSPALQADSLPAEPPEKSVSGPARLKPPTHFLSSVSCPPLVQGKLKAIRREPPEAPIGVPALLFT